MYKSKAWKRRKREFLRKRDGDECFIDHCITGEEYRAKEGRDFDIHHIDENPENWEDDNLCLAAHGCNVRETPRGLGKFHPDRIADTQMSLNLKRIRSVLTNVRVSPDEPLFTTSVQYMKSHLCKPIIDQIVDQILEEKKESELGDLIDAASRASTLSPDICRKWIKTRWNSHNGDLEKFERGEMDYIRRKIPRPG